MSAFNWIDAAITLFNKYGGDAEVAYEALKDIYIKATSPALTEGHALHVQNGVSNGLLPDLLTFRRRLLAIHAERHLPTEIIAAAAKAGQTISQSEAEAMVAAGKVIPGPLPPIVPQPGLATAVSATSGVFANIVAFLQQLFANLPTILNEVAADIGPVMALLAAFGL